jgi:hypothetical protein
VFLVANPASAGAPAPFDGLLGMRDRQGLIVGVARKDAPPRQYVRLRSDAWTLRAAGDEREIRGTLDARLVGLSSAVTRRDDPLGVTASPELPVTVVLAIAAQGLLVEAHPSGTADEIFGR